MRGDRLRKKIKGLLTLGKLQEALQVGVRYIKGDQIIVLSSEFHANRRDYLNGFIVNQRYNVIRNRITLAYLELLKDEELIAPLLEYRRIWKPRRLLYILLIPFLDFDRIAQIPNYLWIALITISSLFVVNETASFLRASDGDNGIQVDSALPKSDNGEVNVLTEGAEEVVSNRPNPIDQESTPPPPVDSPSLPVSDGDPNSSTLDGITTGTGSISGDLGNRTVTSRPALRVGGPPISGVASIKLCVDTSGIVISDSVEYTVSGSTIPNGELINAAIADAKKWRFSETDTPRECGIITYNFRVK